MFPSLSILAALSTSAPASGAELLVPQSPGWVISFLLLILGLFVAAALLGPLIRRFNLEPSSQQYFSDDPTDPRRR